MEQDYTFADPEQFSLERQRLERRRRIAQQLLGQPIEVIPGQMVSGRYVVPNLGHYFNAAMQKIMAARDDTRLDEEEQALARREAEASRQMLSSIPDKPGPERLQAQVAAMRVPSLREAIKAQMLGDEQAAKRLEASEQAAANRYEKEQDRIDRGEQRAADRVAREDLRRMPAVVVHTGGGGSGPANFGGAAPVIGMDPRTETPVYRHTKTGQLFRYDENGQPVPHEGAIGPKPVAPSAAAQKAIHEGNIGIANIDAAIGLLQTPEGQNALGLKNVLPGAETVRQYTDPAGIAARAAVSNIGSLKLHDRSGAAVTISEFPRLRPFIPSPSDSPNAATTKLQGLKAEYARMVAEWGGKPQAGASGGWEQAKPSARLKFNPATGRVE